jgi:hypothetical protein
MQLTGKITTERIAKWRVTYFSSSRASGRDFGARKENFVPDAEDAAGFRQTLGSKDMTKDQAIEACARALVRSKGNREENWGATPWAKDFATNLAICLEELNLLPQPTSE